jgi:hypothetical protein
MARPSISVFASAWFIGLAACGAKPPIAACFGAGGFQEVEGHNEATYEIPVDVHFEIPDGRPPWRTTVIATTEGPVWSIGRGPNGSPYCLSGSLLLQDATSSFELMMEDGPFTFTVAPGHRQGSTVEREADGDGLHVQAAKMYPLEELPVWLMPQMEREIAVWRSENPADEAEFTPKGLHYRIVLQRGVAGVEPRGVLQLHINMTKPVYKAVATAFVFIAMAEFTFPDAESDGSR